MSLYGANIKVDGVVCGSIMRGMTNGSYNLIFECEYATLEQIKSINWTQPVVEGDSTLPAGYGFIVTEIDYDMNTDSYTVRIKTNQQYYGDVAWYQAQATDFENTIASQELKIQQKDETIASQELEIQELESRETADSLKKDLNDAYTRGVESNG